MSDQEETMPPEGVSADVEARIVRRLDGELDGRADEALGRELLRDPGAHRLMDEYAAADAVAGEALRAAFGPQDADGRRQWARLAPRLRRPVRSRAAGIAAAAGVLLTIGAGFLAQSLWPPAKWQAPVPVASSRPARAQPTPAPALPLAVERLVWQVWDAPKAAAHRPSATNVGWVPSSPDRPAGDAAVPLPHIQGPRRSRRAVDRHIFGAFDEAENTIYLLGVDRVRTRVHAVGKDL